jgi:hypothetical protein
LDGGLVEIGWEGEESGTYRRWKRPGKRASKSNTSSRNVI